MAHVTLPDEVCIAAINLVFKPLGTSLNHYMPVHKSAAIEAMRGVLLAQRDHNLQLAREEIYRVGNKIAEGVA